MSPYFVSELPATAFTPAAATSTVVPTTAALTLTVVATTVTAASATVTTEQPLQRMQTRACSRQARMGGFKAEILSKCGYKIITLNQVMAYFAHINCIVNVCIYHLG